MISPGIAAYWQQRGEGIVEYVCIPIPFASFPGDRLQFPCRIALLEDADKKLWVMTLDWDVNWLDYSQNPNSKLADDLIADATRIRDALHYIMEGAATGDF